MPNRHSTAALLHGGPSDGPPPFHPLAIVTRAGRYDIVDRRLVLAGCNRTPDANGLVEPVFAQSIVQGCATYSEAYILAGKIKLQGA